MGGRQGSVEMIERFRAFKEKLMANLTVFKETESEGLLWDLIGDCPLFPFAKYQL
jgi:hypothetical protein